MQVRNQWHTLPPEPRSGCVVLWGKFECDASHSRTDGALMGVPRGLGHADWFQMVKWLLIPVVGKIWRDVSRLDVWASSMVLPAPPEEVEHHL